MGYDRASYKKNKADALFRVAFHDEVVGRTEEAIRNYEKAIACCPDHHESHLQLSRIYEKQGLSEKAVQRRQVSKKSRLEKSEVMKSRPTIRRINYENSTAPAAIIRSLEPMDFEEEDPEADKRIEEMLPNTWERFFGRFRSLREVQRKTVPVVLQGRNAIAVSSTSSGKTEAIFAPLIERLLRENWKGLSIIYVSPTRALVNDIKNRIEDLLAPLGKRVAVRSGDGRDFDDDHPQSVLITTPESLDSFIAWKRDQLNDLKAVILDELHMIDGNYRGDQLRILLRRLGMKTKFNVYAISATVSDPKSLAARYMKDARLVRVFGGRGIDYRLLPTLDQVFKTIKEKDYKKVLIFCNTPQEAEEIASRNLKRQFPALSIRVHHGRLQTPIRVEAERALRDEERILCACTSTLEVGVDIGDIDLVVLASRPISVSSIAQRIGRGSRKKERIQVMAVARTVGESIYYEKVFEAILRSKFDNEKYRFDPSVIVQQILSSLSSSGRNDDFFSELFAGVYDLEKLHSILCFLQRSGYVENKDGIWLAAYKAKEFGPKLFSNIPGYESIRVIDQRTGVAIGNIELPLDNVFVLGGQAWLVRERKSGSVLVVPVDSGTEIPNFTSYDRFGSFFDLLPEDIRIDFKCEASQIPGERLLNL